MLTMNDLTWMAPEDAKRVLEVLARPFRKTITLRDLKSYDGMYYVGFLVDIDGDGWVSEEEAIEILNQINK